MFAAKQIEEKTKAASTVTIKARVVRFIGLG